MIHRKPISDGYLGLINSTPIDYVEINISKKYHVWSKCITRLSHNKALLLCFVYSLSLKSILYYDYRQTDVLNVITNRLESKIIFSIHE